MADTFDDIAVSAPELSFKVEEEEPKTPEIQLTTGAAAQAAPAVAAAAQVGAELADSLNEKEVARAEAFVSQIDINDSAAILNYGAGTQKKMADFSEKALDNVRTKDMGEIGKMVASLVTELKNFDVDEDDGQIMGGHEGEVQQSRDERGKHPEQTGGASGTADEGFRDAGPDV